MTQHPIAAPRTSWVFWRYWLRLLALHSLKCPLYMCVLVHFVALEPYRALVRVARASEMVNGTAEWVAATLPLNGRDAMDATIFVAFTCVLHTLLYVTFCGFFFACDRNGWLQRFKLDRAPKLPFPWALFARTVAEAAVSQILVEPAILFLIYTRLAHFPSLFEADGRTPSAPEGYVRTMVHIAGQHMVNELGFYFTHRLAHEVPWIYKTFHKIHHMWRQPTSVAAEFAHPVETVFVAQIPTLAWCVFFSSQVHPLVWLSWLAWRTTETYECHSGYCFRGTFLDRIGLLNASLTEHHDIHHLQPHMGFYGTLFTDSLFGTMTLNHLTEKAEANKK
jgi:sterol desaturase/sphingolipid hydroxylase (fatty acid hydroxylase superfamily)